MVDELLASAPEVFGDEFVGLYLHGSLARRGFGEESDIDYCVVTARELPEAMHADGSQTAVTLCAGVERT